MIGIRMHFTAGRYHATAWDHHVNEGVPEWPPAPWRVLRALVAAGYRTGDEDVMASLSGLVERLSALPVYHLPPASSAHLRHYMPTDDKPVKVLDSFISVGEGAREPAQLCMWWPEVELAPVERALLERLVPHVAYLGRAESWVELSVLDHVDVQPNAVPVALALAGRATPEQRVRVLAAQTPDQLAAWLRERSESSTRKSSTRKSSTRKRGLPLPESVLDVLSVDTAQLRRHGWSRAPGSRWVDYQLDDTPAVRPRRRARPLSRPCGVVFELDSAVLPKLEHTLLIAERMRAAAMRASGDDVHWQLSGKDQADRPRRGHEHAHFIPLADERDPRHIARILIWAKGGFEPQTWRALQALAASRRTLYGGNDRHPVELILSGYGDARQMLDVLGHARGVIAPSTRWISATPFVPPRFTKQRAGQLRDTASEQLVRLCEAVLGEVPVEAPAVIDAALLDSRLGWSRFVRVRGKDRARLGTRRGWGFELRFARAISGPVCLGYGSHFGLGRFVGVDGG